MKCTDRVSVASLAHILYLCFIGINLFISMVIRVFNFCCYACFHASCAGILRESRLYEKLEQLNGDNHQFVLYGDPAYPLRQLLMRPYGGARLTKQQDFNIAMSSVRQSVEWGFGKIISEFAFLDFKKKPENTTSVRTSYVQSGRPTHQLPRLSVW